MRRLPSVLPMLLALAGCAESPSGPSVAPGSEFQLRSGETATVATGALAVRFDVVASDSRCPADALCVTLGHAEAVFTVTRRADPAASVTLRTHPRAAQSAAVGEWVLTLTHLDPYPYSSRPIAPYEYRATLRVDRAAGSSS